MDQLCFIKLLEKNLVYYINNLISVCDKQKRKKITRLMLIVICTMLVIINNEIAFELDDDKCIQIYSFIENYSGNIIEDNDDIYLLMKFFKKIQQNVK